MDPVVLSIALVGTITFFLGVTFALFLLYLTLKIKSEFRESLRLEMDRHRTMYEYIGREGTAGVEELIKEFEGMTPSDMRYPSTYFKWQKFLLKRVKELGTLEGSKNSVSLSPEVKRFFVYDNPSVGDLFRYISDVYLRRQPSSL